jgi:uncharacterized protein
MPLHVIIDGYNFIRQSAALRELEQQALEFGREALVEKLAAYRRIKHHKVTLVFDGSAKYYFQDSGASWKGIGIKFSRHGESADSLIKKMAAQEREKAVVVSSDRDLANFAAAHGATTIDSDTFEAKLLMAEAMESQAPVEEKRDGGTTKKKGPSRKLPKNRRRSVKKIKKL